MGAEFLAGAVFGILVYLSGWIVMQLAGRDANGRDLAAKLAGFLLGILAGYGVNHLLFVGFLGQGRIPLGGPGALSLLVFLLTFLLLTKLAKWHIAQKSHQYQAIAGLVSMVLAVLVGFAVDYLLFIGLLGFRAMPTGGIVPFLGSFAGYLLTGILLMMITRRYPSAGI